MCQRQGWVALHSGSWTLLTLLHLVVFGFVEVSLGLFTLQVMVQPVPVQKVIEKQASLNWMNQQVLHDLAWDAQKRGPHSFSTKFQLDPDAAEL